MQSKIFVSGNNRFVYKIPSTSENDETPIRFTNATFENELQQWKTNKKTDRKNVENALLHLARERQMGGDVTSSSHVVIQYARLNDSPTFNISASLYDKIRSQLLVHEDTLPCEFNELLWLLYMRYDSLGLLSGFSGAITPETYTSFSNDLIISTQVECFASFFNHTLTYYFGIYYELEKYFGCLGNFFDVEFISGFYLCNPPFTVGVINRTIRHIKKHILRHEPDAPILSFLIFTPTWDKTDRDQLGMHTNLYANEEKLVSRVSLRNANDSLWLDFVKYYVLYAKGTFLYFDYEKEEYIPYCATTVSLLSTDHTSSQLPSVKSVLPEPTIVCTTDSSRIGGKARRRYLRRRRTNQRRKPSRRKPSRRRKCSRRTVKRRTRKRSFRINR